MATPDRTSNTDRNALSTPRRTAGWAMARNQIAGLHNSLVYGTPTAQLREEQAAFIRSNPDLPFTNPASPMDPFGPNRPVVQRGSLVKSAQEYSTVFLVGLKLPFCNEDHIRGHFERFGAIKVVEIDYKEKWAHLHFENRSDAEEAVKHPYDGVTGRIYLPDLTRPPMHQQFTLAELDAGAAQTFRQDYPPLLPVTNAVRENQLAERVYPRVVTEPGFEAAISGATNFNPHLHRQRSLPNLRQRSDTNPFSSPGTGFELIPVPQNTSEATSSSNNMDTKLAHLYAMVHDVKNHTSKLHGRVNQQQTETRAMLDQASRIVGHASYIETQASNISKKVEVVPGLLQKVHELDTKVDRLHARMDAVQANLSNAETRVNEMNHNLMNVNLEFRGWYNELCTMANNLRSEFDSLKRELAGYQAQQNSHQGQDGSDEDDPQVNGTGQSDH